MTDFAWGRVNGQRYGEAHHPSQNSADTFAFDLILLPLMVVFGLVWWLLRHFLVTSLIVITVGLGLNVGVWAALAFVITLSGVLIVWRWRHRSSFEQLVANRFRKTCRSWWIYRRRWQPTMKLTGLAAIFEHAEYIPKIGKITSDQYSDRILVRMLSGQAADDWEARAEAFANTFGALTCRVHQDRPGRIWLHFLHRDPLEAPIRALPMQNELPESPTLDAYVGVTEDGQPWVVRLSGTHTLLVGATDSGKSWLTWTMLRGIAPHIGSGLVQVWGVDPKGGMELTPGIDVFTHLAFESPESMTHLLEDAAHLVQERAVHERQCGFRQHVPTPADPFVLLVVDEIGKLSYALHDRDLRNRINAALWTILTQGRAVGVGMWAAIQDPRKEILKLRDLFPTRIALRLNEPEHADLALGQGARARGALCDRIPMSQAGVGYVLVDGEREPVRVRGAQATDADIRELVTTYPSPTRVNKAGDEEIATALTKWQHSENTESAQ